MLEHPDRSYSFQTTGTLQPVFTPGSFTAAASKHRFVWARLDIAISIRRRTKRAGPWSATKGGFPIAVLCLRCESKRTNRRILCPQIWDFSTVSKAEPQTNPSADREICSETSHLYIYANHLVVMVTCMSIRSGIFPDLYRLLQQKLLPAGAVKTAVLLSCSVYFVSSLKCLWQQSHSNAPQIIAAEIPFRPCLCMLVIIHNVVDFQCCNINNAYIQFYPLVSSLGHQRA